MLCVLLPYPNFLSSAKALDDEQLRVQLRNISAILDILNSNKMWGRKNPAVLQWKGFEPALLKYREVCATEWLTRRYKNRVPLIEISPELRLPTWFGDPSFHAEHRRFLSSYLS